MAFNYQGTHQKLGSLLSHFYILHSLLAQINVTSSKIGQNITTNGVK
jgi:hypothetical protein